MSTSTKCSVLVRRLGRIGYLAALDLQHKLASRYVSAVGVAGELIMCEHDPVYTFGLREDYQTRAVGLENLGCELVKVRRGGLTTFHGPGQLVCYPILNLRQVRVCVVLNLRQVRLGARDYVRSLEQAVMMTLSCVSVESFTTHNTGVWVTHPHKGDSKICAIGIQISRGVAYHGLALNCNTDLSWFQHITPCGMEGKHVTSLTDLCQRTLTPADLQPLLEQNLAYTLGLDLVKTTQTCSEIT